VLVGLTDLVLLYFLARRIFDRGWLALVAVVLLALTPAHFIHSRLAVDHLYPLPFMLAWLLCLSRATERSRPGLLFLGSFLLGVGFYSYLAAVVLMPVYFLITCLAIYLAYGASPRQHLAALAGFLLPVALLAPWLIAHPAQYASQIRMYNLYDASRFNPLQGLKEVLSFVGLTARSNVYYNFFNPSFLFFSGDSSLINATRRAGVFLLPLAVLLPLGVFQIFSARDTRFNRLLLLGLLTAPLASALTVEVKINRGLVMLPYAAIVATFGVEFLLTARKPMWRVAGVCLLLAVPWQFAGFYRDYLQDYRVRSSVWFEGNMRGAIEEVLSRAGRRPVPAIYLSTDFEWIQWYWRFYLTKYDRLDLLPRTVYFDPRTLTVKNVPAGSVMLIRNDNVSEAALGSLKGLPNVRNIPELDGSSLFAVFDR
jgi:4-amino-4-deoxy-L-arabinose transferase-like glycosyltransferase